MFGLRGYDIVESTVTVITSLSISELLLSARIASSLLLERLPCLPTAPARSALNAASTSDSDHVDNSGETDHALAGEFERPFQIRT